MDNTNEKQKECPICKSPIWPDVQAILTIPPTFVLNGFYIHVGCAGLIAKAYTPEVAERDIFKPKATATTLTNDTRIDRLETGVEECVTSAKQLSAHMTILTADSSTLDNRASQLEERLSALETLDVNSLRGVVNRLEYADRANTVRIDELGSHDIGTAKTIEKLTERIDSLERDSSDKGVESCRNQIDELDTRLRTIENLHLSSPWAFKLRQWVKVNVNGVPEGRIMRLEGPQMIDGHFDMLVGVKHAGVRELKMYPGRLLTLADEPLLEEKHYDEGMPKREKLKPKFAIGEDVLVTGLGCRTIGAIDTEYFTDGINYGFSPGHSDGWMGYKWWYPESRLTAMPRVTPSAEINDGIIKAMGEDDGPLSQIVVGKFRFKQHISFKCVTGNGPSLNGIIKGLEEETDPWSSLGYVYIVEDLEGKFHRIKERDIRTGDSNDN